MRALVQRGDDGPYVGWHAQTCRGRPRRSRVIATDPETGAQAAKTVEHVFVHDDTMFDLVIDGEIITTTEDHPFWSVTDQRFERADELAAGEKLLAADGRRIAVSRLTLGSERRAQAYNLSVEGIHTYHVGLSTILVHNAGCDEWAADFVKRSGGEIKTFESPLGRVRGLLGPYRPQGPGTPLVDEAWGYHMVAVREGKIFDQWHPEGVGIGDYKQMFDYGDIIGFGFRRAQFAESIPSTPRMAVGTIRPKDHFSRYLRLHRGL